MLVVDVEASGLGYDTHSILSVGALDISRPDFRFYKECRVWSGAHIASDALEVNGFTLEQCQDESKMPESELITEFLEWSQHLGDRTIAGQNPSFDRDMLKAAARRAKLSWDLAHRTIDSHSLCYMHMITHGKVPPLDLEHRRSALDLDAVLIYCGIPKEPEPHNALTGALCHAEVIHRLLYGTALLPEFSQYPVSKECAR
jgi:DNA polymerase III epsilon subunit-like protein